MNDMQSDRCLEGDKYEINEVKYEVVAFGEVVNGEHHYISSEEFNKRMKEGVPNGSRRRLHQSQRHTVLISDN